MIHEQDELYSKNEIKRGELQNVIHLSWSYEVNHGLYSKIDLEIRKDFAENLRELSSPQIPHFSF